jgi:PTS system nitrogen regulatory IIA component
VDYDAPDGAPVVLLFVLVVPPQETRAHLEVLATLARMFQDPDNRASLRRQATDSDLYQELVSLISRLAA